MIPEPRLEKVKNGQLLNLDLVNSIIKRIEYIAKILKFSKPVAGDEIYVEPHSDGTIISFLQPVGGGARPSFRGGIRPFPNPFWPKRGTTYSTFRTIFDTSYGLDYVSIPSSSLVIVIRNGQERYEYFFDFSGQYELDEEGYIKDFVIHSPEPFTIYYADGTSEEAIEGGGYYPYPYFFKEYYIKAKPKAGSISFGTSTPSMRTANN